MKLIDTRVGRAGLCREGDRAGTEDGRRDEDGEEEWLCKFESGEQESITNNVFDDES